MTRRQLFIAAVGLAIAASSTRAGATGDRHHYTITARVRPLVLFWITRSGVGDAVITRQIESGGARYSLLIGTDPERAPLHINRWGYIEEEIRGAESRLIGLMTQSDEESIEQAEANIRGQATGRHPFQVIDATADGERSRSRVRSIATPQDYTLRHLPIVLDLARQDATEGRTRVIPVPAGTRPGFLCALVDAMRDPSPPVISYVYFGRLYELRRMRTERIANLQIGPRSYGRVVAADFVTTSRHDGEQTRFSITYGIDGPLAAVPLRVVYQPRWWMQVELTIDDGAGEGGLTDGGSR
jgi:hypothetical protein